MNNYHKLPVSRMVDRIIDLALAEDIGHGDITTEPLLLHHIFGKAEIIAKEQMVVAGLDMVKRVYEKLDSRVEFNALAADGDRIDKAGTVVAELKSSLHTLLTGERVALNFLQKMCGIATHVRSYVDSLPSLSVRLTDTRKTTPGWRVLEKYAVRVGGAYNHRMGLYDGVLIKDNHISACGGIARAVEMVRSRVSHLVRIEVETENLKEVKAALEAGADVIMLDNMDSDTMAKAVELIAGRAETEVSGGVEREQLERLSVLGVNVVSSGALTHAARFVDLSMSIAPLK